MFPDTVLQSLIQTALQQNYDVRLAAVRILEAQAQLGITRADQFPQPSAGVDVLGQRPAAALGFPSRNLAAVAVQGSLSWELDFWGRYRRATEAARAILLASEWGRRAVLTTLVSQVSEAYFGLRALDAELDISRRTLASRQESLRLTQVREQGGATSLVDVRQAEQLVYSATGEIATLERQIAQQENFISALLGHNPAPIQRGGDIDALLFPAVPDGLPASLLERRPDIRQAEQNLIAANADIGVAKAAYYPDISLTALLGLESAQLSDLFKGPSKAWSFGVGVLQPIFNAGRIRSQVAQAEALQRQALYTYQKAIINAFQDVENALIDRTKFGQIREEQAKNVAALRRFRDLADLRYREGATIYLEVGTAEQSLFNAQLAYVTTQAQLFQSYANLYKAMGGGWVEEAEGLVGLAGNANGK